MFRTTHVEYPYITFITHFPRYSEVWYYNYCNGGNRPGHEGKATGHFTQVDKPDHDAFVVKFAFLS